MFKNFSIGIIGGGQLGRMLALKAFEKGFKVAVLDPNENAPASSICHHKIVADYGSKRAIDNLIKISDVITYEFENIEVELLDYYKDKIKIYPNHEILKISKNRNLEKEFARKYGILIPEIFPVKILKNKKEEIFNLYHNLKKTNKEWILKKAEGGYDGKYQISLSNTLTLEDFELQISNLFRFWNTSQIEIIIEEKIDFEFEFSIIACGHKINNGINVVFFAPFINYHKNGILRKSFTFKDFELNISEILEAIRNMILDYNYIGILTLEFFYKNGKIYFNELAPRVHNSGHLTMEAYNYSQFECHIRAISNLPILQPELRSNAGMINLISINNLDLHPDLIHRILNIPNTYFHYYGKINPQQNRKMGHINILNDDKNQLLETTDAIEKLIYSH
ncbi:MAG: ATP-grasp domain-containing protein [Leptonema sp. (in: bacteria)]